MATEAARVCIDNGDFDTARQLYKKGHDLGLKEPNISPGRKDLWEYRWEHAEARLSARRGNKAEADKHIAAAKSILDAMKDKDPNLSRTAEELSALPDRLRCAVYRRPEGRAVRVGERKPERRIHPMPDRHGLRKVG